MAETKYNLDDIIVQKDGKPYDNNRNALSRRSLILQKEFVDTELVEMPEGGFGLKVIGFVDPPKPEPTPAPDQRRPKRIPLGNRNVLTANYKSSKYEYRFVNDSARDAGRIKMFEEAGWEIVHDDQQVGDDYVGNSRLPGTAVTKPAGVGVVAVLMRKRKDWFQEDMQIKQNRITQGERGLVKQAQMDNLRPAEGYQDGIKIADK